MQLYKNTLYYVFFQYKRIVFLKLFHLQLGMIIVGFGKQNIS
jgi:hypothetical protein